MGKKFIDNQKLYEFEKIIGRRKRKNGFEFKIKWKNYSLSAATWEPEENLSVIKDEIEEYNFKFPFNESNNNELNNNKSQKIIEIIEKNNSEKIIDNNNENSNENNNENSDDNNSENDNDNSENSIDNSDNIDNNNKR